VQASSVVIVPISSVVVSDTPRSGGEDLDHVQMLAELQGQLPPIVVHRRTMRVIDGHHRLRASVLCGQTEISVQYFDGEVEDAHLLSVAMNVTHGLPLSSADRMAAVKRIIVAYPSWSDRVIAAAVGLSPRKVSQVRKSLAGQIPALDHRIGRDGKVRPLDGTRGRERAAELILQNPDASLRAIARQAGIAPATVADVRDRMRDGAQTVVPLRKRSSSTVVQFPPLADGIRLLTPQAQEELLALLNSLQSDPSLRSSDVGRLVLRMLHICAVAAAERERILTTMPTHCAQRLSELLIGYADVWRALAVELRGQSEAASA
jgi:ParB-like chromosome segregation protein Spo0J